MERSINKGKKEKNGWMEKERKVKIDDRSNKISKKRVNFLCF